MRRKVSRNTKSKDSLQQRSRQVLNNGRPMEWVDLNELIKADTNLFEQWLPEQLELEVSLAPGLPLVIGNREQLEQIIMDLMVTAALAAMGTMTKHGGVSLTTSYEVLTDMADKNSFIGNWGPKPGDYICLAVNYKGMGMNDETTTSIIKSTYERDAWSKAQTAETRYSLKLLPQLLRVVREHQGNIAIQSQAGVSTTFKVFLPVREPAVTVDPLNGRSHGVTPQTAESAILVIDDDFFIRKALTEILSLLPKMTIFTATDGDEGLQIFQQQQPHISLVLLDLNMPVMNGRQTYERLQQIAPQVKVIVSSSLSQAEARSRFGELSFPTFLRKPYDADTLLNVVQTELAMT